MLETHKLAEIESRSEAFISAEASKPFGWDSALFVEWATVAEMLQAVALPRGARIADLGCGSGWTTLFLVEAGFDAVGLDLVPANIELARERGARWGSSARFEVADLEALEPPAEPFDGVLLFEALHHCERQDAVLAGAARQLRPGGWLLLGEPTWLHRISPRARRARRELGWLERGIALRGLRRDLRAAGFAEQRRFFGPTRPYEGRIGAFAWQLARLLAANVAVAPQAHLWLAARRG
jgi:SAM-dependent methyltransferase